MTPFSPTESSRLSAAFAEAHEQATPGDWRPSNTLQGVLDQNSEYVVRAASVTPYNNIKSIATLRNNAASASAQLAAVVEEIAALRAENRALRITEADLVRMPLSNLEHHKAELLAIINERDSLRARLAEVAALCEEACEIGERLDREIGRRGATYGIAYSMQPHVRLAVIRAKLAKGTP